MTVMFVTLAICLVSTLIIVPLMRFYLNLFYGLYLLVIYVVFLLVAILVEVEVI